MREVTFLKRNAEYWKSFEAQLKNKQKPDPDDLADKFVRLTDDLSYSRTFYPQSNTTRYLNELTTIVHQKIYKNKRERKGRFARFFRYEVPEAAYALRKQFLYSLIIFTISALMGVISQMRDDTFARYFMGDGYVNKTIENIKQGDAMGIYKSGPPLLMFVRIAINNIKVSFYVFVCGLLLSVPGAFMLFRNGMMLGLFLYFFQQYHLLYEASISIWIHGTLEISAIILAGGAGLALGNSLLFPGTYSRIQSLKTAARNGIKIMIGLVPVFITAAFLESFVTRHTDMPEWLSWSIILSSLAFIVFYYIIYPYRIHAASRKLSHEPA